jgi:LysR family transcriptional regulator, cys regulon transcriptional activator
MNLQQLRFVQEAARRGLNLTEVARALHTSQPGVSKAILELEQELGIDIFERHGKRIKRVTEPGQRVLESIDVILRETANLKRIGDDHARRDVGILSIATTHTQARYMLPRPITQLRKRYPDVSVRLHQGSPEQVARMLIDESADVGLATETLATHAGLVTLPCYEWQHVLVVPHSHPLAEVAAPTLEQIAAHPLVSYQPGVAGRSRVDAAFARRGLEPTIVLEAVDSDVVKTYVRLGLGAGIVAEMAVGADAADVDLVAKPLGALMGTNVTSLAFKRGSYLKSYVYSFAELLSERFTRKLLQRLTSGTDTPDDAARGGANDAM